MSNERIKTVVEDLVQVLQDFMHKHEISHDEYRVATDVIIDSIKAGEESLFFENMDSPKKAEPSDTPYTPPASSPSDQLSTEWAYPSLCKLMYASIISCVSHVPPSSLQCTEAQFLMTSLKAVSKVM